MTNEDLDTSTDVAWEILSIALKNEDDNDLAEVLFSKAAAILKQNHLNRWAGVLVMYLAIVNCAQVVWRGPSRQEEGDGWKHHPSASEEASPRGQM